MARIVKSGPKSTRLEEMSGDRLNGLSVWELRDAYDEHWYRWPRRIAAEAAYALAVGIKAAANAMSAARFKEKEEYMTMAEGYARKCLELLSGLPAATLENVAVTYSSLCGVPLPDRFYDDYARRLLQSAGLLR